MVIFKRQRKSPWLTGWLTGIIAFAVLQAGAAQTTEELLAREGFSLAQERVEAPDFTLETLSGPSRSLSSYRGKVVFLNFWATWCGPCRAEMPSMQKVYDQYREQPFEIVAVDLGEPRNTVEAFARELDLTFPILLDYAGETGSVYGVRGIPTTYIVDKEGRLVARLVGSREWETEEFKIVLDQLIAE